MKLCTEYKLKVTLMDIKGRKIACSRPESNNHWND